MRSTTRKLFRILNNEKFQPVQFLEIRLQGSDSSSTLRFTDAGEQITWDGQVYQQISFNRGEVDDVLATDTGDNPGTTVNISNINAEMAALINGCELEGAQATLRMADRRHLSNPRDSIIRAKGEIIEPQLTEATLTFTINNVMGMLERVVVPRRLFQSECNYPFGSRACGVNATESPFSIGGNVQTGSTAKSVVIAQGVIDEGPDGNDPAEFWAAGYVVMVNGAAATQGRPIQTYVLDEETGKHIIRLRIGFFKAPAVGDRFIIRRGCRKTLGDCKARQGSFTPHGGYPYVPYGRITPIIVSDY